MTLDTTSVGSRPVRPDARRAYGDNQTTSAQTLDSRDQHAVIGHAAVVGGQEKASGVQFLQQAAANYASLAKQPVQQQQQRTSNVYPDTDSTTLRSRLYNSFGRSRSSGANLLPPSSSATGSSSSQVRMPSAHYLSDSSPALATSSFSPTDGAQRYVVVLEDADDPPAGWDAAPRLSMSSAESSGGSEVKTPESVNAHLAWRANGPTDEQESASNSTLDALHERQVHSPALVDMSEGLAAVGFEAAETVARSSTNQALVDAAQQMDDVQDAPPAAPQSPSRSSLAQRSATIKAKRPDGLLKLPSCSFETDRTVTPSASEKAALEPEESPRSSRAVVRETLLGDHDYTSEPSNGDKEASGSLEFPLLASKPDELQDCFSSKRRETDLSTSDSPDSPVARTATSPDSWRSLLPEHDPYFIPPVEASSSRASSRTGSDVRDPSGATAAAFGKLNLGKSSDASRRWSNESQRSTFSLPGPVPASATGSCSASSSLYDLDGSFNSNGSRAAFAPLQFSYNQSSKSLASPTLSNSGGFGDALRGATKIGRLADSIADQRRHASFSTFDNRTLQNRSTFQHSPFVHPDYFPRSQHPPASASSSKVTSSSLGHIAPSGSSRSDVVAMSPPMGLGMKSFKTFGSDDGRESWPSSRNSLSGIGSSTHSHVAASGPAAEGPSDLLDNVSDTLSQQQGLASAIQARLPGLPDPASHVVLADGQNASVISSIPSVVSTSTMESICTDGGADAITTTRTTTTTTTTTTFTRRPSASFSDEASSSIPSVSSSQAPSSLTRVASLQSYPSHSALAPYEVSPLSPPSLPFLDSRPAPSSTDLSIDTQPSHYTLKTKLPGFTLEGITLATKHHCQLVIVADKWDESEGGHFERRITFGNDADLKATKASFDGSILKITVPRRG